MREIGLIAAFGAAMLLLGCATVTRGTSEAITFESVPSGAEVHTVLVNPCHEPGSCQPVGDRSPTLDTENKEGPSCVTPCTIQITRANDLIVTFMKPGYQSQTVKVGRQVTGTGALAVGGNAIAGGMTGVIVDSATGAGTDHVPNPVNVTLVPIAREPAQVPGRKGKQQKKPGA